MALTSELDAIVRVWSGNKQFENQTGQQDPLLENLELKTNMAGAPAHAVDATLNPSLTSDASVANAAVGVGQDIRFVPDFGQFIIPLALDHEGILAAQGAGEKAMIGYVKRQHDKAMNAIRRGVAQYMYGAGDGVIGVIASVPGASPTITLATPSDVWNFTTGQVVRLVATASSTGAVRTGTLTVLSVDPAAGTVTFTANVTTGVAAAAQLDFIIPNGMAANAGALRVPVGFRGWCPQTVTGAFYGVTRTNFSRYLVAGTYTDQSAQQSYQEAILNGIGQLHLASSGQVGDRPVAMVNAQTWGDISKEFNQASVRTDLQKTKAGNKMISFELGAYSNTFYISQFAPRGEVLLFDAASTQLWARDSDISQYVGVQDSTIWLRDMSATRIQYKAAMNAYLYLAPLAPSRICRIVLPTLP